MVVKAKRGSGGVSVPDKKELSGRMPIEDAGIPAELTLFLSQHTGAPSKPLVNVGDDVKRGQKIAEAQGAVSACLHAPTSGKVKAIEPRYQPVLGREVDAIVLTPDGENTLYEGIAPVGDDLEAISQEKIREVVREAGLVGLGGAAFPTAVKLTPPPGKTIDTYLLNGVECEPYLTADQKLMEESAADVVFGFRALMKGAGVKKGIICIEDNKPDAIKAMEEAAKPYPELEIAVLSHRYPRGGEKQLIEVVLGREVPPPPGLPLDVGVIVSNVGTAYALAMALKTGLPLVERIVSVTGEGVARPVNLRALIGTPVSYLIEKAGGFSSTPGKVVLGGPMMGVSVRDTDVSIVKGTSGVLVLPAEAVKTEPVLPCIRCGRCVRACPMNLLPFEIDRLVRARMYDGLESVNITDCIECGCCVYTCPSKRLIVQSIRLGKDIVRRKAKK